MSGTNRGQQRPLQQVRADLRAVFANNPRVVAWLDNPTAPLDADTRGRVAQFLSRYGYTPEQLQQTAAVASRGAQTPATAAIGQNIGNLFNRLGSTLSQPFADRPWGQRGPGGGVGLAPETGGPGVGLHERPGFSPGGQVVRNGAPTAQGIVPSAVDTGTLPLNIPGQLPPGTTPPGGPATAPPATSGLGPGGLAFGLQSGDPGAGPVGAYNPASAAPADLPMNVPGTRPPITTPPAAATGGVGNPPQEVAP